MIPTWVHVGRASHTSQRNCFEDRLAVIGVGHLGMELDSEEPASTSSIAATGASASSGDREAFGCLRDRIVVAHPHLLV